jgi:hypothetical protein
MTLADEIELPQPDPGLDQAKRLNDAAMLLHKDGRGSATSLTMLRRALAMAPDIGSIWSNYGLVLWKSGDVPGASIALHRALDLSHDNATVHGNLGVFLSSAHEDDVAAEHHLSEAIRLDPDNLTQRWDRSLLYLSRGDWKRGFADYELRIDRQGRKLYPKLPVPLWAGEDLTGKTIYIQGEQGIGDRFMFSRYLSWVHDTWPTAKILCCIFDGLVNTFWEFRDFVEFLPMGVPWPEGVDYGTYLLGLPYLHGSTPTSVPPDPGLLRRRILKAREEITINLPRPTMPSSIKVGIVWTGNPEQNRNHERSIPLEMMMSLADDPRIVLYSFQCNPGNAELHNASAGDIICDLSPGIEKEGWIGTGCALMEMDVLVTVCTSIAHFAGAIGIPTWTLLCAAPYWVWTSEDATTPWYPTMKLFRQRKMFDWSTVIADVKAGLSALADTKAQQPNDFKQERS